MRTIAVCLLLCLPFFAGCGASGPADPMFSGRVGDTCTVYFRLDALGMGAGSPAPPGTGSVSGADTQISGKLLRANAGWVCLGVGNEEYTIPREAILLVKTAPK
jgi:hypothetical protein